MLLYRRRRLDSLNPCSISFSDQIPTEGRADKCRGAFCDGCDRPGLVGISRRHRGPIALGLYVRHTGRRSTVTPPLLDAWAAYHLSETRHLDPSGLSLPLAFGINTRLIGSGR